jgi:hypothetical protein
MTRFGFCNHMLLHLAAVLSEPFSVLYVLSVARGGSVEGPISEPWMNRTSLTALVESVVMAKRHTLLSEQLGYDEDQDRAAKATTE